MHSISVHLMVGVMRMSQNLNDDMELHRGNISLSLPGKMDDALFAKWNLPKVSDCMFITFMIIADPPLTFVVCEPCSVHDAT